MSKLSTKNIKTEGGGIPKSLQPGNHKCKIVDIQLDDFRFIPGALHFKMYLETEPIKEGFEGFFIDKSNESKGRHLGQVGWVKASEWAFADGETKGKIPVSRDQDILKFIKTLCQAYGKKDWLDAQDDKHDTIESLIAAFIKDAPYKDVYLNWCIGGKEYQNKQGYTNFDLFLPKFNKAGVPFETLTASPSKLIKFKEEDHIRKAKVTQVQEFGESDTGGINTSGPDFSLD